MSGESAISCCCGGACSPGILISTKLEAVSQVMASWRFSHYGLWDSPKGVCIAEDCIEPFWKANLLWECGITTIVHDEIEDLARIKRQTAAYCKNCGVQGTGNCGCGDSPAGSESCCGPDCNQVGQYTGHTCIREYGTIDDGGGCSCGCTGYNPQGGSLSCSDSQDQLFVACHAQCNWPDLFIFRQDGPTFYWPGGFSWQQNNYYTRDGNYCFPLCDQYDEDGQDICISMPVCNGAAGGAGEGTVEPIVFHVWKYCAPEGGFEGGESGKSDCGCTCCKPQLPGDPIGDGDYIEYVADPVWKYDYGVSLTLTGAGGCAGTWSVECTGDDIVLYLNGNQYATVSLLQNADDLNTALLAATNGCVRVSSNPGWPNNSCPRRPQDNCIGPANTFGSTTITATGSSCGTPIVTVGLEAGSPVPQSWVGTDCPDALLPKYRGNAQVFSIEVPYQASAGTLADFANGFEVQLDNETCQNLDRNGLEDNPFPNHPLLSFMPSEGEYPVALANGEVDCHCDGFGCPAWTGEPPNNGYEIKFDYLLEPVYSLVPIGTELVNEYLYSDFGCCGDRPDCIPGQNLDCTANTIESVTLQGLPGCSDCGCTDPTLCTCYCGCYFDPLYILESGNCICLNCCPTLFPVYREQQKGRYRLETGGDKTAFYGGIRFKWWLRRNH